MKPKKNIQSFVVFDYEETACGECPYGTKYKSLIPGEIPIEIIGNFSIHGEQGLVHIPSTPAFKWQGIKVSSPEAWYVALLTIKTK